jgi:hypothetical protein
MLQIARPGGNSFERWKWRHRYFIWTWSLTGATVWLLRVTFDGRAYPELFSWFTLQSYLIAIPVAAVLGALYCLLVVLYFRVKSPKEFLLGNNSLLR